jgi:hypothetical protein
MENNTTACRPVGAGDEHRKVPQINNNNPKKRKKEKLQQPSLHPNPARPNQTKENNKDQILAGSKLQLFRDAHPI